MVTTFELPGCYDMWTVIAPVRKEQVGVSWAGEEALSGAGDPLLRPHGLSLSVQVAWRQWGPGQGWP